VLREREMLRLGAAIARERRIPADDCARALEAARRLRQHANRADAGRLLPVATAALRDADNGGELAARIGEVLRAPVRILRGEEEAGLMFAAFRHRMVRLRGLHLGLDLGGGSLELALGDGESVHWEATLPLGVVRLHGELAPSDPMSVKEERALRVRVRDLLAGARERLRRRAPFGCIATGGTVGSLARWIATRRTRWPTRAVGQLFVPLAELREVAEELVVSTHEQRLATPGVQKQRADLLPTGAVVLEAAVRALGLEGFLVSDWGLREGVMLEALGLAQLSRRASRRGRVRRRRRGRGAG
jgi:exopolyphosphatase/guanosine-5'-triphosphate,3'-diphosphate pyrophosphatase